MYKILCLFVTNKAAVRKITFAFTTFVAKIRQRRRHIGAGRTVLTDSRGAGVWTNSKRLTFFICQAISVSRFYIIMA